ncbi:hypothetical protein [Streptomyces aureus]|uniref:hypothetical protein n=1 Tax=Streptomyces aureus TaxID=193461 RepID=UPI0006E44587|nr:hypothetical protein [Streptomyces aureus]
MESTPQDLSPAPGSSLLSLLGLDAEQDAVYRLLVDRPDSTPASVTGPGADPGAVALALQGLVDRGLASAERGRTESGTGPPHPSSRWVRSWSRAGRRCTGWSTSSRSWPSGTGRRRDP